MSHVLEQSHRHLTTCSRTLDILLDSLLSDPASDHVRSAVLSSPAGRIGKVIASTYDCSSVLKYTPPAEGHYESS